MFLVPPITGRITSIHVSPPRPEWRDSADPGFREAEWAARLDREGGDPIVAACYYSSDAYATCHTAEAPATGPTPGN